MTPVVEARGLTKRFGEVRALTGLDLVAESGQVTAVLGPNGAGKTTFVSAIATLVRPDGGELRVAGVDAASEPAQVRKIIGLAGQSASVEPAMTGRENLDFVGRLFGLDRGEARSAAAAVLDRLDLADAADRWVRTYSGGCAGDWIWERAWWDDRSCSCSTNPPPASTRAAGWRCGTPSAAWWRTAMTSC